MRFSQSNCPCVFELKKVLNALTYDTLTISAYYTKFKMLWDDMLHASSVPKCVCACTCKTKYQLKQYDKMLKVTKFLMGLNEVYTNICDQSLIITHIPPMTSFFSLL